MIKNIVIGVLVVITLLMTLYGNIKANEATKNAAMAAEQAALAQEQAVLVKEAVSNQANDIRTAFEQEMWAYQRLEAKYDSLLKVCN